MQYFHAIIQHSKVNIYEFKAPNGFDPNPPIIDSEFFNSMLF